MVLRVVAHFRPKSIQSYEKFLTFANILCIFLHFDAFFRKTVYLSVANSRALISPVTYVFQHLHLILIFAREHSAPARTQPRTYIIYAFTRTLTHAHVRMHVAICQRSDLYSLSQRRSVSIAVGTLLVKGGLTKSQRVNRHAAFHFPPPLTHNR